MFFTEVSDKWVALGQYPVRVDDVVDEVFDMARGISFRHLLSGPTLRLRVSSRCLSSLMRAAAHKRRRQSA